MQHTQKTLYSLLMVTKILSAYKANILTLTIMENRLATRVQPLPLPYRRKVRATFNLHMH